MISLAVCFLLSSSSSFSHFCYLSVFLSLLPFVLEFLLLLSCSPDAGSPLPNVTWWREDRLLDETWEAADDGRPVVNNSLVVERLTREWHNATLTCAASNTHKVDPLTTSVVVKMFCKELIRAFTSTVLTPSSWCPVSASLAVYLSFICSRVVSCYYNIANAHGAS